MITSRKRRRRRTERVPISDDDFKPNIPEINDIVENYVYLTVNQTDESLGHESMFIHYHCEKGKEQGVYYKKVSDDSWFYKEATIIDFQNEPTLSICHISLTGLEPNAQYEFYIGGYYSHINRYLFKTLPATLNGSDELVTVYTSDFHQSNNQTKIDLLNHAKQQNARFIVVTGDWVDDFNLLEYSFRWIEFWNFVAPLLKDSEGNLIPLIPGVGNHEVRYFSGVGNMVRPFFVDMFGFPEITRGVVDFGDYLSVIVLDTETPWQLDGNPYSFDDQTVWLESVLSTRTNQKHITPTYHQPKYPSHRSTIKYDDWVKLFDQQNNIKACFEAHDHTMKQTYPIKGNKVDSNGIIYFGDGGVSNKYYAGNFQDEWYIDKFLSHTSHIRMVRFTNDSMNLTTLDIEGNILTETII